MKKRQKKTSGPIVWVNCTLKMYAKTIIRRYISGASVDVCVMSPDQLLERRRKLYSTFSSSRHHVHAIVVLSLLYTVSFEAVRLVEVHHSLALVENWNETMRGSVLTFYALGIIYGIRNLVVHLTRSRISLPIVDDTHMEQTRWHLLDARAHLKHYFQQL